MRIVYLNKVQVDSNLPAVNFSLFNAYGFAEAGAATIFMAQTQNAALETASLLADFGLRPRENFLAVLLPKQRKFGIRTNQWFYLEALTYIRRFHSAHALDAVISRDPGALPYLARLKALGVPVFYQPHNFYIDLSVRPDVNRTNAWKYHFLEKHFIARMSGLLCLQESQAAWYRRSFPRLPVFAARPGLIRMHRAGNQPFEAKVIGYVGSLQLKKGILTLLEAVAGMEDLGQRLLLVGGRSREEMAPVQKAVDAMGIARMVEMTGWLRYSEVEKCLDRMSIGVLPLEDTFYNRYLTAPNKLFDYLSRGLPIVASDLPAVREFIRHNQEGILVPAANPGALRAALETCLSNRTVYEALGTASWQTAQRNLWEHRAEDILHMIASVRHSRP